MNSEPAVPIKSALTYWNRVCLSCAYWIVLCVSIGGLGRTAFEQFQAGSRFYAVSIGIFVVLVLGLSSLWNYLQLPAMAFLAAALIGGEVCAASVFFAKDDPAAFILAGHGTAFWMQVFCLADASLLGLVLVFMTRTTPLKLILAALALYSTGGFAISLGSHGPFETVMLGVVTGAGPVQPFLQPAYLTFNVFLPLGILVLVFQAIRSLRRLDGTLIRACLMVATLSILPVFMGLVWLDRLNVPNLAWMFKKPQRRGGTEVIYTPFLAHSSAEDIHHKVVVRTPGYDGKLPATWEMLCTVSPGATAVDSATVFLTVRQAASGVSLASVTTKDLQLLEDGQEVSGFRLEPSGSDARRDTAVVVVVDQSDAMKEPGERVRVAVRHFLRDLSYDTTVGCIRYGGPPSVLVPLAAGKNRTPLVLPDVDAAGSPTMMDALQMAVDQLATVTAHRKLILLLAATDDAASRHSFTETIGRIARGKLSIITVLCGDSDHKSTLSSRANQLAITTGGLTLAARPEELDRLLETVGSHVDAPFRLTYHRANSRAPTIAIDDPPSGTVTRGPIDFRVHASGPPLDHIELYASDRQVGECSTSPCQCTLNPADLAIGPVMLKAVVLNREGERAEVQRILEVADRPPQIVISKPLPGGIVAEPLFADIAVGSSQLRSVEAFLDGTTMPMRAGSAASMSVREQATHHPETTPSPAPATDASGHLAHFGVFLAPGAMGPEGHQLRVRATDSHGATGEATVSFRVEIPSVSVSLPGFSSGSTIFGRRALAVQVRSQPPNIPVTNVCAYLDGRPIHSFSAPPYDLLLDTAGCVAGPHTLTLTAANAVGFSEHLTLPFKVAVPRFGIQFPDVTDGKEIAVAERLVPTILDEGRVGLDRVEYRIAGQLLIGTAGDYGMDLDPGNQPPGPTRIHVRAILHDNTFIDEYLRVVIVQPSHLDIPLSAVQGGSVLWPGDLAKLPIEVELDGKPLKTATRNWSAIADDPLCAVLAVDRSAEMIGTDAGARLREEARFFVDLKRAPDRIGIVSFDDQLTVDAAPTTDVNVLGAAIKAWKPGTGRRLLEGIRRAVELAAVDSQRGAVLVMTAGPDVRADGNGPASAMGQPQVVQFAQQHSIPVYIIGLGSLPRRDGGVLANTLRSLAEETGGAYFESGGPAAVAPWLTRFTQLVQGQARLSIRATQIRPGTTYHLRLKSTVDNLQLLYPPVLRAP